MRTIFAAIIATIGLAGASSAFIELGYLGPTQLAPPDQPPTREAEQAGWEVAPTPTNSLIDGEGVPLFLPAHGG